MVYAKRLGIAVVLGIICGLICAVAGKTKMGDEMTTAMMWSAIFDRALIGLIIGISIWKLGWFFHGIIIGFLGSLPIAMNEDFLFIVIFGIIWGFLIELFTTFVFKAPMKMREASPE